MVAASGQCASYETRLVLTEKGPANSGLNKSRVEYLAIPALTGHFQSISVLSLCHGLAPCPDVEDCTFVQENHF